MVNGYALLGVSTHETELGHVEPNSQKEYFDSRKEIEERFLKAIASMK